MVKEKRFPAKAVMIRAFCDQEGCEGELILHRSIDSTLSDENGFFLHVCNKCGNKERVQGKYYPYIDYMLE